MTKSFGDIKDYEFQSFTGVEDKGIKVYEFQQIVSNEELINKPEFQKIIKQERSFARETSFKINPIVEEHRGLKRQEHSEYEARIQEEVERRVREIQEEAYKAGFEEGVSQAKEEVYAQMRDSVDQKMEEFSQMVTSVLGTQEEILKQQKTEIYQLIRNLTKWIILRELNEDGKYIERLLERLLHETQIRANLLIQVNENDFAGMPDVLAHVQARLGELKNVRVEIDPEVGTQGIVVESENGIINASMEEQFAALDKLFQDVLNKS